MIALLNTFVCIQETYNGIADKFARALPKNYERVDIMADAHRATTLKSLERKSPLETEKMHVASLESKVPSDFSPIMKNGENKTRLMEHIVQSIESSRVRKFNQLSCRRIVISTDNKCISITHSGITEEAASCSSQEEADTRMILHCHEIAS